MWGATLRHDLGDAHPLVGRSAPDLALDDGTRLAAHLQTGQGLLLDLDTAAPLREWSRGWKDRIAYVASGGKEDLGMRALLVRPDGIVAWVGNSEQEGQIEPAVRRWFGGPSTKR